MKAVLTLAWAVTSPLEIMGVILGLVYVALAIRENRACWVAALLSTMAYLWVFYRAGLYMQALLQLYYVIIALYGWRAWTKHPDKPALVVSRSPWAHHGLGLLFIAIATGLTVGWLTTQTTSVAPFLDSVTTWASVYATWLMARKKIDNWPWWLIVDSLIVLLCWQQALYASVVLYGGYLILVLLGWRSWAAELRMRTSDPASGLST
jgi:nicotinamide mononucleotide transporter